jgi:L-gulono-1,4-lactone dehydrogenase
MGRRKRKEALHATPNNTKFRPNSYFRISLATTSIKETELRSIWTLNRPNQDTMALNQSIKATLRGLEANPQDEQHQKEAQDALNNHRDAFFSGIKEEAQRTPSAAAQPSGSGRPQPSADTDWVNCVGQQRCTPLKQVKPQSLKDLVDIVSEAKELKQRVRAVGSGHAFSDIARTDGAVLVSPVLLDRVSDVESDSLRESARGQKLIHVQSGITVQNFITELDNRGLALINEGGYTGQTISGTLSTGTHGSGITFGPLASFVRSIVLVSETGTVYQIEPVGGITDPAKFSGVIDSVEVNFKQDDEWFNAVLVAMGCMGVIYSFTMEVTDAFSVKELRTSTTWEKVKGSLEPSTWNPVPPIISAVDHFELVLNPYYRLFRNACVKVERTRLGNVPAQGERQDWVSALLEQASIDNATELVKLLNKIPFISPIVIDQAIMTLVESKPYIDKSFNVFSLGEANDVKALALELHCDAKQCVPTIDKLLAVFQGEAKEHDWYMAGPLGIRFVAASDAFLAPEAGRMTCTIELDMLVGSSTGEELARHIKEKICGSDSSSARVHWGLDLDFVTKDDIREWYPNFERWNKVYQELNSVGMFNNKFTDRMGISTSG